MADTNTRHWQLSEWFDLHLHHASWTRNRLHLANVALKTWTDGSNSSRNCPKKFHKKSCSTAPLLLNQTLPITQDQEPRYGVVQKRSKSAHGLIIAIITIYISVCILPHAHSPLARYILILPDNTPDPNKRTPKKIPPGYRGFPCFNTLSLVSMQVSTTRLAA